MKTYVPEFKTFILGRYSSLLVVLASIIIFQPLVVNAIGKFLLEILFIAALIAGLQALEIRRGSASRSHFPSRKGRHN